MNAREIVEQNLLASKLFAKDDLKEIQTTLAVAINKDLGTGAVLAFDQELLHVNSMKVINTKGNNTLFAGKEDYDKLDVLNKAVKSLDDLGLHGKIKAELIDTGVFKEDDFDGYNDGYGYDYGMYIRINDNSICLEFRIDDKTGKEKLLCTDMASNDEGAETTYFIHACDKQDYKRLITALQVIEKYTDAEDDDIETKTLVANDRAVQAAISEMTDNGADGVADQSTSQSTIVPSVDESVDGAGNDSEGFFDGTPDFMTD